MRSTACLTPENMGFTRRGMMDMLPDEIAEADMRAIRKFMAKESMGLREYKCPICKKRFEVGSAYRYRLYIGKGERGKGKGQERVYCSYTCFRVDDKKKREREKAALFKRWTR